MSIKTIIQKLFLTSLMMFTILSVATIPIINMQNHKTLRTNLEIQDIASLPKNYIYLINQNNDLVRTSILLNNSSQREMVLEIIDYLKENNDSIPKSLNGYIPNNAKVLNCNIDNSIVYLDFSKELLSSNTTINKKMISGIVFSLLELDYIKKISINIEGKEIDGYPKLLDKSIGINQDYDIKNRSDITKVVIFYLDDAEKKYYLPVTKYLNDKREKIEIIIEQLKNPSNHLKSPIDNELKLIDYKEDSNVLFLNFNEFLLNKNEKITEETLDMISLSAFENYDVYMVMFEIDGKEIEYRKK